MRSTHAERAGESLSCHNIEPEVLGMRDPMAQQQQQQVSVGGCGHLQERLSLFGVEEMEERHRFSLRQKHHFPKSQGLPPGIRTLHNPGLATNLYINRSV